MTLNPAPPNTGIVFCRTDLSNFEIPASIEFVARVSYATTLMRLGVMVATVEHLLSALAGCQIDNCIVELDSLEVPIMDGSAKEFIALIKSAGSVEQFSPKVCLKILETVEVTDGNRSIRVEPKDSFSISSLIDFSHPLIGKQEFTYSLSNTDYISEIAPARTFGFTKELDALRQAGLIRGGSLDNAIVLTEDGLLNNEGLRFIDEFARHKILDIIGDLALIGRPIIGQVIAKRSGHALHSQLVSHLLRNPNSWKLVEMENVQQVAFAR
jgi:UDP-3-O-[3-hydroxymyristoyl] N-acetylglucosamine deacetylase